MRKRKPESLVLIELRARVEQWRKQGGGRGSRIPEELWQEALGVAAIEGLYATARATRFKYESLKTRYDQASQDRAPQPAIAGPAQGSPPVVASGWQRDGAKGTGRVKGITPAAGGAHFVEFQVTAPPASSRTTIELVGRHGDRMRVELAGPVDVVQLAHTFWSGQA